MKGLRVLALVIFVAAPAEAATLPLRPGTFVMIGEPCADAPLATLFHYDGRSFSYPHATQCRFQILSHGAQDAKLRETCYALGDGTPATPSTTTSTYTFISATEVRVGKEEGRKPSTYRWCSVK
jgi:hypothetical protein